eukprot:UN12349
MKKCFFPKKTAPRFKKAQKHEFHFFCRLAKSQKYDFNFLQANVVILGPQTCSELLRKT